MVNIMLEKTRGMLFFTRSILKLKYYYISHRNNLIQAYTREMRERKANKQLE